MVYRCLIGCSESERGGKNEQTTSAEDRRYAHLPLDRHLQVPNHVDRHAKHRDVGDHVEYSGC